MYYNKKIIMLAMAIGTTVGGALPMLFVSDPDAIIMWSIVGGFAGGVVGIWLGVWLGRRFG